MYDYGPAENAFLKQLGFTSGSELPALHGEVGLPVGTIDLAAVIEPILVDGFYNYHGSITTPPCEETVGWLVMATPLEATKAQLDMGKAIFPDPRGARPLQELYGRSIGFNGKPSGYPAPLPVNTWLLEGQGQSGYFGAGLTDVDLDEASGAIRRGMFGGVFAMLLAVVAK